MLRRYIVVKPNLDALRISYSSHLGQPEQMPTKLEPRKLQREMVDFERGPVSKKNVTLNAERFERFQAALHPGNASEMLDYLMECVIRGSKVAKGKK